MNRLRATRCDPANRSTLSPSRPTKGPVLAMGGLAATQSPRATAESFAASKAEVDTGWIRSNFALPKPKHRLSRNQMWECGAKRLTKTLTGDPVISLLCPTMSALGQRFLWTAGHMTFSLSPPMHTSRIVTKAESYLLVPTVTWRISGLNMHSLADSTWKRLERTQPKRIYRTSRVKPQGPRIFSWRTRTSPSCVTHKPKWATETRPRSAKYRGRDEA